MGMFGLATALGCTIVWIRADFVGAPRLKRPAVVSFSGRVEMVERLVARQSVRLTLAPSDAALPGRVRVSIDDDAAPAGLAAGSEVQLRARLAPPPPMALPGTYDFAKDAWFRQIGAVGKALGPVEVLRRGHRPGSTGFVSVSAIMFGPTCRRTRRVSPSLL